MQLPLSASALVLVGVGAALACVAIVVVLVVRRYLRSSRSASLDPDGGREMSAPPEPAPAAVDPVPSAGHTVPGPALAEVPELPDRPAPAGEPAVAPGPPASTPLSPRDQAGSGRTVAAAVAQAFAVRAAASRPGAVPPPGRPGSLPSPRPRPAPDVPMASQPQPERPQRPNPLTNGDGRGAAQQMVPSPNHRFAPAVADARDRLLAVLLPEPDRAVGAVVELEACLCELDRLSGAVRQERAVLRDVLRRLTAAGLRPEQLARLAGMPLAAVEAQLGGP
jgi:hypothetical protein